MSHSRPPRVSSVIASNEDGISTTPAILNPGFVFHPVLLELELVVNNRHIRQDLSNLAPRNRPNAR